MPCNPTNGGCHCHNTTLKLCHGDRARAIPSYMQHGKCMQTCVIVDLGVGVNNMRDVCYMESAARVCRYVVAFGCIAMAIRFTIIEYV